MALALALVGVGEPACPAAGWALPRTHQWKRKHTCALDTATCPHGTPRQHLGSGVQGVRTRLPVTPKGALFSQCSPQSTPVVHITGHRLMTVTAAPPSSLLLLRSLDWSLDLLSVHRSVIYLTLSLEVSAAWYLGTYLPLSILLKKHQKQRKSLMSSLQKFII